MPKPMLIKINMIPAVYFLFSIIFHDAKPVTCDISLKKHYNRLLGFFIIKKLTSEPKTPF